ncbi:hypothetical protein ACFQS7_27805 [Dankookia sp. GCM10030260]|uniref:hypothetical protein n=1 Tax=Dankookia sp. GCM10030260 TaxID=3273390 RepID=UPI0036132CFD
MASTAAWCSNGGARPGVYEAIPLAMRARVQQAVAQKGLARSGIIILDAQLKLRQVCCDPRLLDLLGVLLDEGRRVLIFSQFTSELFPAA